MQVVVLTTHNGTFMGVFHTSNDVIKWYQSKGKIVKVVSGTSWYVISEQGRPIGKLQYAELVEYR